MQTSDSALDDFSDEPGAPTRARPAPPAGSLPAIPAHRPSDIPRPRPTPPRRPAQGSASKRYRGVWWFVLGSLFGGLVCVPVVYVMTASQPRIYVLPPDAAPVRSEPIKLPGPPVDERREPPPLETKTVPAATETPRPRPTENARRQAPPAAVQAPPPQTAPRRAFVGSLHVDSTPRGARVFIDRKLVGVTPLLMTDVSAGSHVIRLETDGHSAWSSAIRVVAERQTDVSPTLAPSRQIAAP